ncbi:BgTH12-05067 [Blumeria graminis f. sp. triticale]|uniref:BgTH12-05067 n=1 Tax=Blumeria graminis f. sp. triticale TaxID=1689686 RepID=A0A9W4GG34_BLUGR|nr:BgTH12-05067 [Blumeria graminis f. sp. triticale]
MSRPNVKLSYRRI